MNEYRILLAAFSALIDLIIIIFLFINWYLMLIDTCVEPSLHAWNESLLIGVYDIFIFCWIQLANIL